MYNDGDAHLQQHRDGAAGLHELRILYAERGNDNEHHHGNDQPNAAGFDKRRQFT